MKADVWWVVGGALAVFLTVLGVLVDRYLCAVYWWRWVGPEWREHRRQLLEVLADPIDFNHYVDAPRPGGDDDDDPDCGCSDMEYCDVCWPAQLHVINLDAHRDRPIAQLTHYEVEAVIRDLGVPEWVPLRLRTAA